MAKKSFRAQQVHGPGPTGPRYPALKDLRPGALRRWGLAAMGAMLLGGCWHTTNAAEQGSREKRTQAKGTPDGGAHPRPRPPRTAGVPYPLRLPIESDSPTHSKDGSDKAGKSDTNKKKAKQGTAQKHGVKQTDGSKIGKK
jgi:hypothetical protein